MILESGHLILPIDLNHIDPADTHFKKNRIFLFPGELNAHAAHMTPLPKRSYLRSRRDVKLVFDNCERFWKKRFNRINHIAP